MISVESPTTSRAVGVAAKVLIGLAALMAIAFVVIAALPYRAMFGSEDAARQNLQWFQFGYWPRRGWLLTHIAGGVIALLSGPVQLWLGLHHVKMRVHRRLGLVYVAGMAIGSIGAIGLALRTDGGLILGTGLFFLAMAWISTTSLAYVAIRRGLRDQHREWTIRSYVVTFAFVTFRVGEIAMLGAGVPLSTSVGIMAWASWSVPLLITELIIQGGKLANAHRYRRVLILTCLLSLPAFGHTSTQTLSPTGTLPAVSSESWRADWVSNTRSLPRLMLPQ